MHEEDGGAVRTGAGRGVQELIVERLEVIIGRVNIADRKSEMGERGARFIELTGYWAIWRKRTEQLQQRGAGGRGQKDLTDLIRAEDVFLMDDGKSQSLVGGNLGGELLGRNREGEMMDADEAGERGNHCPYGRAKRWGLGHRIA